MCILLVDKYLSYATIEMNISMRRNASVNTLYTALEKIKTPLQNYQFSDVHKYVFE